jgi:hypothetical protein
MYRVLIVEDDAGITDAVCAQGAQWGLDVTGAVLFCGLQHVL